MGELDVMLKMKSRSLLLLVCFAFAAGCGEKRVVSGASQENTKEPVSVGDSQDTIEAVLGKPERVGFTSFGDAQWTYPNPNAPKEWDESIRKTWVVFDKDSKVKELHRIKVCWLTNH